MITDKSAGIIPLRLNRKNGWEVLLVQLHAGHWGCPKGHLDPHESMQEAAIRELFEETGLSVKRFLTEETFSEHYFFTFKGQRISKTVIYFVAEVEGKLTIQDLEVKAAKWVPLETAEDVITFPAGKQVMKEVVERIKRT